LLASSPHIRTIRIPKRIAQAHIRHGDPWRQLLRYLRFRKRLFGMLFSAQLPCASRMIQGSHSRNVETSIKYQDSVLDHRSRANVLKRLVRGPRMLPCASNGRHDLSHTAQNVSHKAAR
jgi:hypothetical protein